MTSLKKRGREKIGNPVKRYKKIRQKIVKMSRIKRKNQENPEPAKLKFDRKHRKSQGISVENLKMKKNLTKRAEAFIIIPANRDDLFVLYIEK